MTGNFTINSDAIFNAGSYLHSVGENIESDGILNGNTSTFTMTSTTGQLSGSPGTVFHHFINNGTLRTNSDFNVDGNFTNNGTFDASLGALIMVGANPSVIGGTTSPSTIAQLTVSKTGGGVVTTTTDIGAISALIINSGILFISGNSLIQSPAGGALIILAGGTLKLGGTNTLPAFSGYGFDVQSTVDYAGTTQLIANSAVYGNLTISAAGDKTSPSFLSFTATGNFSITAGNYIANNNTHKIEGNWIMTGGTFNNTNSIIRFNGPANQNIRTIAPFNSIQISKPGGAVTLLTNITVNAILTFTTGSIETGTYAVILPATGTVSGAAQNTGWVNGNLQKNIANGSNVSRTYEIGDTTYYTPATVLFASVSSAGDLKVSAIATDHPQIAFSGVNPSLNVNRYWTLVNAGTVFTSATTTFRWVASDVDAGASTLNFNTGVYNGSAWSFPAFASPLSTSVQATGLTAFGSFAVGERSVTSIWTGAAGSANWFTAANWYGGVPGITIQTTIPTTLQPGRIFPVIDTGVATIDAITIQNAASLTVINAKLQVHGAIVSNGVFDVSAGTLELNGSTMQTIPSGAFANNNILNLLVNNNVTLAGPAKVSGILRIAGSNQTFATGGFLTLTSTENSTASIAALPVDGTGTATSFITGDVAVQRFISNRRAWRLLTAPLSNTGSIYNAWQNAGVYEPGKGMFITGANPGTVTGLDASTFNATSMRTFNKATQVFSNITNTKTSNLSNSTGGADNVGYFVFVRGDRNPVNLTPNASNSTTLTSAGKIQTGRQQFSASAVYGSYTMFGNPYASPVDFNNVLRSRLVKRFYAWDPSLNNTGGYVVLDDIDGDGVFSRSDPSSSQDKNIQSGQAFFVQTDTAGTASLTFYENSKSGVVSNTGFRPFGTVKSMAIQLNLQQPDSVIAADAVLAEFDPEYCSCVNLQDAVKFTNTNETFSLLRNGTSLAIERRPLIARNDTLFLRLTQASRRNYQLVFKATNLSAPNLVAFLEDKYTGINTIVSLEDSTLFNFVIDAQPASIDRDRFRLVFKEAEVLAVTYTKVSAVPDGKDIAVKWEVAGEADISNYEVQKSRDGRNFTVVNTRRASAPDGNAAAYGWLDTQALPGDNFYRIRNINRDGSSAYSKVVKVNMSITEGEITVYPNPVTDGTVQLRLNGMPAGKYSIRLLTAPGQLVWVKEISHAGDNAIKKLSISGAIAKGIYNLEITDPGHRVTTISIVHQ